MLGHGVRQVVVLGADGASRGVLSIRSALAILLPTVDNEARFARTPPGASD